MNTQQDFEELLKLLEKNNVFYMIVGGYAVAYHGYPRFTNDMDIFYKISSDNIKKLKSSLLEFGFKDEEIPDEYFFETGNIIKFGIPPVQIDLLNEIDGVTFEQAERNIVKGFYGKIKVNFIGLDDLKKNKNSTKRLKDKADIEELDK